MIWILVLVLILAAAAALLVVTRKTQCRNCGFFVPARAQSCPNCGCRLRRNDEPRKKP